MSTLKVDGIRSNSATSDAITLASNGTCTANITNNLSNRNLIINGAMQINQRVQTGSLGYFNPVTSSIYTLDRWKVFIGSSFDTDSAQITKSTQSPDGFSSSMKWDIGNTETPSSNQNCGIEQKIEGQNMQGLAYGSSSAKTMTLSFWVYSNKTGTYCVQLIQADGTKYQLHEYTVSSSNTWEKKTITVVGNTSNAINDDNTQGMRILWHLTCGSSDHVAASSTWTSGDSFHATSNQVNLWDNASNHWYLTGCQLEVDSGSGVATDFEHRSFGQELALCQRYYYLHVLGTGLGGNNGETSVSENATMYSANAMYCSIPFPCQMRAKPTLEVATGSNYYISFSDSNGRGNFTGSNTGLNSSCSQNMGTLQNTDTGNSTSGHAAIWRTSNAAAKIAFTSEL